MKIPNDVMALRGNEREREGETEREGEQGERRERGESMCRVGK